jgi:secreted trypsin-like serine protease
MNYVLTAAHCVNGRKPEDFLVRYGTINYRSGEMESVKQIIIHDNYKVPNNDIALVKLVNSLIFDAYTKAIPLHKSQVPVGETVIISGFGTPSKGELRYVETSVIECDSKYVGLICFKNDDHHGACRGDSGGPAIYESKLIGITSFGLPDCNETHAADFDAYTSVPFYYNWIIERIE